jgi:hypothetical protein
VYAPVRSFRLASGTMSESVGPAGKFRVNEITLSVADRYGQSNTHLSRAYTIGSVFPSTRAVHAS